MNYSERIIGITSGRKIFDGVAKELDKTIIHQIYQSKDGQLIIDMKE